MPRRPPGLRYPEALAALRDAHLTIVSILATARRIAEAREQLYLLSERLERVLARDNHRSR